MDKTSRQVSAIEFIKHKKVSIIAVAMIVLLLLGTIISLLVIGEPDPSTLSTVSTDLDDANTASLDATDSDLDDDFIIDENSLTADELVEEQQAVEVE